MKDNSFTILYGGTLLNASLTSNEITDNEVYQVHVNALRTGEADLRFYVTTVQDG